MLFGGLVTIPFWGYQNLSVAETEIMMSDLPHVEYRKEKKYTAEQEKMLVDVNIHQQEQIKEKGLMGALGMNLNLNKAKTDRDAARAVTKN